MIQINDNGQQVKIDVDNNTDVFVSHPSEFGMEKQYRVHMLAKYPSTGEYKVVFEESEVSPQGGRYNTKVTSSYTGNYDPSWDDATSINAKKLMSAAVNRLLQEKRGIEPLDTNGGAKPEFLQ